MERAWGKVRDDWIEDIINQGTPCADAEKAREVLDAGNGG
jgi:hypothetical protein